MDTKLKSRRKLGIFLIIVTILSAAYVMLYNYDMIYEKAVEEAQKTYTTSLSDREYLESFLEFSYILYNQEISSKTGEAKMSQDEINEDNVEVTVDGEPVKMTPIEYKILLLLMKNPGRVFSAEEIYERVWNERAINTDTIMVHVRNIREKIEVNPREPKYLKVVWGVGYKIEKQA